MNIKKYLREQAEKDAEKLLTEADREFCMRLAIEAQQTESKEKTKKRKRRKIIFNIFDIFRH